MKTAEYQDEALARARGNLSMSNYPAILQGFIDKGIPEEEIRPRENVFTFGAWRALGRYVRRGEHGVRVLTWVPMTKKDPDTGKGDRMNDHRRDEDCTVDPATDTCSVCGVGHGDPCPDCGARAFHRRGCFQWTRAQRQAVKDSLRGMGEE